MNKNAVITRLMGTVFFLVICTPSFSNADPKLITTDDLYDINEVSLADLSMSGNEIIYSVSAVDSEEDEYQSTLLLLNIESNNRRVILENIDYGKAQFSPDGKSILFISSGRGKLKDFNQLWAISLSNKTKKQLTKIEGNILDFEISPNNEKVALVVSISDPKQEEDETQEPYVIDRYQFKQDYKDFLGSERDHLFVVDLKTGQSTQLSTDDTNHYLPSWSPDSKQIAYVTKKGDFDRHNNWDIYIQSIETKKVMQLTTHLGEDSSPDWGESRPQWSPDGKKIAYLFGGDPALLWYALQEVSIIDIETKETEFITSNLDRNTAIHTWSEDGENLYFIIEDDMKSQLAKYSVSEKSMSRITPPEYYLSNYSNSYQQKNNRVVFLASTINKPAEIYSLNNNEIVQLTFHNKEFAENKSIGTTETVAFRSFDNAEIHGVLVKPRDFEPEKKYPLLIRIHGGPVSQYGLGFRFDWQLFTSNNYIVMAINPRGSSGRGHDFQKALFADWGGIDTKDISAALDYALSLGYIDENRLGIGGWSYGGMLTNYVIAKDPRFKAATSGAGIANLLSGFGDDQYIRDYITELGTPWDNTDLWLHVSHPFLNANNIKTPTLFLVGEKDYNVPLIGSEQMYQALRHLEIPTQLIIYPGQHHSFNIPSYNKDVLDRYLSWYKKYLN